MYFFEISASSYHCTPSKTKLIWGIPTKREEAPLLFWVLYYLKSPQGKSDRKHVSACIYYSYFGRHDHTHPDRIRFSRLIYCTQITARYFERIQVVNLWDKSLPGKPWILMLDLIAARREIIRNRPNLLKLLIGKLSVCIRHDERRIHPGLDGSDLAILKNNPVTDKNPSRSWWKTAKYRFFYR